MRIFIVSMDDPVYTIPFIKEIINAKHKEIIGVAVSEGDRMKIGKKRSKNVYLFILLLIMGPIHFVKYSFITLSFKIRSILSRKFSFIKSGSLIEHAKKFGIPTYKISSPNNEVFLKELRKLEPDVIINQSQHILKKEFLSLPKIGVLNRHNALLPKNRGRLTPFWVLYKCEKETGVSIHFVDEGIDSGDIIVQEKYEVYPKDNFNSLVKKNYKVAPLAVIKAINLLESGVYNLIKNDSTIATYNSIPGLKQAIQYRIQRIFKLIGIQN